MSETEAFGGWATTTEGKRVRLSSAEAEAIWLSVEKADKRRREAMPDSISALNATLDAITRLRDEGWRDGIYCPKDGSDFAVIQFGSTGIFTASYSGDWPKGHVIFGDCVHHPDGLMWKALASLTPDEKAKLERCDAAERAAWERQISSMLPEDDQP